MPKVDGVKHRFVRAGEMNFHVASLGPEDAPPVVLVHGWPEHWYAWRLVMPQLAEKHRVIAVDLRGFGWTDIAWEGFDKENMAADVLRVVDALELERFRLVGHDWGAWISCLAGLQAPQRVEQLAVMSFPTPWIGPRDLPSLRGLWPGLVPAVPGVARRLHSRNTFVARRIRQGAKSKGDLKQDVQRIYARDLRASTRARASALLNRTFFASELAPVLSGRYSDKRLEMPVLAMRGKADFVPRTAFRGLEAHASNVRIETVPGAGHWLPEEQPDAVSQRLLGFFGTAE
ncbi:alpha/beta hydrolase [Thermoleophilia bacterium SCSIO 60948]|nr:alpha/beta hydrolase [Thermoleophilia bacterium SCSIO 60948]